MSKQELTLWHIALILGFPVTAAAFILVYLSSWFLTPRLTLTEVMETCWNAPRYL